jgi:hypothetical protein
MRGAACRRLVLDICTSAFLIVAVLTPARVFPDNLASRRGPAVASPADDVFAQTPDDAVVVQIIEGCNSRDWDSAKLPPSQSYREPAMGLAGLPRKYSEKGVIADRSPVFVVRVLTQRTLPAGEYRLLVRAVSGSRLFVDGELVATTRFVTHNAEGHEAVPEPPATLPGLPLLPIGHQERIVTLRLADGNHRFRFEVLIGSNGLRHEIGQPSVAIAERGDSFSLLTADRGPRIAFTEDTWNSFVTDAARRLASLDRQDRRRAATDEEAYWDRRHAIARAEVVRKPAVEIPDAPAGLPLQSEIDRLIAARLVDAGRKAAALTDDSAFLRRVTLDTIGSLPTPNEIAAFRADRDSARRRRVIDRLLADDRWADNWVGYWQDVLAENPGILKPELNNTGPFRWWIYESFLDNKPLDRFATELITMEGSLYYGGPAGFAMASQNDAPLAEKAHIVAKAFLGLEMKCARCHDAPYHPFAQRDLFSLAAMLDNRPIKLPKSSTVPIGPGGRKSLITVSLKPGESIGPAWPLAKLVPEKLPEGIVRNPKDFRERFAAIVTSPRNERFAQVLVNRVWKRYFGAGLVEPIDDWNDATPSHPKLLKWLARELVAHDYDLKHVARLILNSDAYQRVADGVSTADSTQPRLFAAPLRRRMSAEQIVDSLFAAVGKPLQSELLTMDPEVRRGVTSFFNLGSPTRAWQFTSLSNDRDRPALALPVAQSFVDVLSAFGWRDSRTNPISVRDEDPTALQPLTLANGILGNRIARLSDDSSLTALALADQPVGKLVDKVFLRFLSREPTAAEARPFIEILRPGYERRRRNSSQTKTTTPHFRASAVSWSNHLSPEASRIKLEQERTAREGDPPTERLDPNWRERMEDVVWAVVNSPEFVFIP